MSVIDKINQLNQEYYVRTRGHCFEPPCGYRKLEPQGAKYYLVPQNQEKCKTGLYSTEELELWMKGEGPVMATTGTIG